MHFCCLQLNCDGGAAAELKNWSHFFAPGTNLVSDTYHIVEYSYRFRGKVTYSQSFLFYW